MQRVLVSACLLGERVRYNGDHKRVESGILDRWQQEGRVVSICPELAGGLTVPRLPAEIPTLDGAAVLAGAARVLDREGGDVSAAFVAGAERALELARSASVRVAVLKLRSPSCGSNGIHDGTFQGVIKTGVGVTAALLAAHGIAVFGEDQLEEADAALRSGM